MGCCHLFKFGSKVVATSFVFTILLLNCLSAEDRTPPWETGSIYPTWKKVAPAREIKIEYDSDESSVQNGQRLHTALAALVAGERLKIGAGQYTFARKVTLDLQGTETAPISIEALDNEQPPILTRSDARQNLLNIGERQPSRFLKLQGLELVGGSVGIRFGNCDNIWLDQCEIHRAEHGGITANTHNTSQVFLTNNHLHHFEKGTGEAMYLGANHSKAVMTYSVIANNHVHHCSGSQGDGIELKQGSHHNWIVGNKIHDTKYPCLIAYGTDGNGVNLLEQNLLYNGKSQGLQVQGEAIVRNNIVFHTEGDGFLSTDHQGKTRNLMFMHNTIVTAGRGVNLSSWGGREGMVFANNAIYSRDNLAVRFPTGCALVKIAGNVVLGGIQGCSNREGFSNGKGLDDFTSATLSSSEVKFSPAKNSALLNSANSSFTTEEDFTGTKFDKRTTAGAIE